MARDRRPGGIVFMAVWMVVWTAAILIAVYALGAEALAGEVGAALFLALWVGGALFALYKAGRTLIGLLAGRTGPPRRRDARHRWEDGLPPGRQEASRDAVTPDHDPPAGPAPGGEWRELPRVPGPRRGD